MYKFAKKVANHEGFTLVELIVVIAILGILAGIAIPVYSGYINKANQAADVMLLGAVNTALAAACAENDFVTLSGAEIELREAGGKKYIDGVSVTVMADELTTADLVALSFGTYFGENKNTELKYCTSKDDFVWDSTTQTFSIDGVGGGSSTTPSMAELVDSLKPLIVSAIAGSNFEDKENELLDRLQSLTNAAESMDVTTLNTMLNGAFGTFLSEKGIDTTDMQAVANAATLFVAEQMSGLSTENKESIIAAWKTNQFDPSKGVDDIMRRYSGMGLSTLGGMATYYANTEAMVQYVIDNYKDVDGVNQAGIDNFISAYEALPSALAAATDTAGMYQAIYNAQTQMVAALQTAGNTDLMMNIANYGTSNAEADANAFMNAMSSINGNLDALLSYVGEDNLYTLISSLLN